MSRTLDARARDIETRKIQESITNVEKYFGEMCQLFAGYGRKAARLRDKGDVLVRVLGQYADTETPHLKRGMKQFTDNLAKVQDYRHAEVERLEAKVIEPLKTYGAVVRRQREDLKSTQNARERESKQMAQLEKARQRNPSDRQIISQVSVLNVCTVAESELERATMDTTRITRHLEETIDDFEKQKIRDIKKIFGEFVHIEMAFHAKALELYTMAFQSIQSVDEEADLEVFRTTLRPPENQSRLDIVRANSQMSLNRTESFMGTSGSTQHRANLQQMRREAENDEEESEDESEEESEDD
ncbi:CBY1-interacting BAR domain-containing protein 1 isoform X2 [Eucyclogobius newberryi]|uniref:CBY1-interacting BAR domain-containing protein 1 isoform X2 n=1 Tax=Eucyclogobius newberryi TaxID=166745 RepID=UPI003B5BE26B